MGRCLIPSAALTNYHLHGGLKQQKLIILWLCRQEVQNQGVGKVGFSLRLRGRIRSIPVLASDGHWQMSWHVDASFQSLPLSSHGYLLSVSFFSLIRILVIRFRAHPKPRIISSLLNYILQSFSFQRSFHSQVLEIRTFLFRLFLFRKHSSTYYRCHPSNLGSGGMLKQSLDSVYLCFSCESRQTNRQTMSPSGGRANKCFLLLLSYIVLSI